MNIQELVGRKLASSDRMLITEAYKRGVTVQALPNKRIKLAYKGRQYIVRRGSVCRAYNTRLANRVSNMKEVTSRLLRSKGHSAPENTVFNKNDLERAWNWAKPILPVVLKPYNGIMGRLVFVNINNYQEFKECFNKIIDKHDDVLIEEFIEGNEYRFTYVNNQIVGIARRIPANVVGDGKNTIKQLVQLKNEERELRKNPIHKKIKLDKESERVLSRQGYSFDNVPNKGEMVFLRENSNVSTGGDAVDVTDKIDVTIKEGVRKAIRSIPGLRVCGVDVIINDDGYYIIEINEHPMLSMHHFPWIGEPRDVISKVIDGMFPETVNNNNDESVNQRKKSFFSFFHKNLKDKTFDFDKTKNKKN